MYITYLDGADTVIKKLGSMDYAYPLLPRMDGSTYTNIKTDLFQPTENTYTITATTMRHDNMPVERLWNYALGSFYRMTSGAQEIIIKCTKPIRLQKVLFGIRQAHWSWNSCTIYASDNGSNYTYIGSVNEKSGVRFIYDIPAPNYNYFYKFCFPATNDYKDIDALELYGNIAD